MNDFDYEVYRKKNIAGSARRRKIGSKSKKCSLPSDRMTAKQWKERNGKVMSYSIGRPMKWDAFGELPRDLKEEYINGLIEKYSVNAKSLAEMFGVSYATLNRAIDRWGLSISFTRGKKMSREQVDAFNAFMGNEPETQNVVQPVCASEPAILQAEAYIPENPVIENEIPEPDKKPNTKMECFTMSFSGEIDVDMIANSLRYIMGNGSSARIQIHCEFE